VYKNGANFWATLYTDRSGHDYWESWLYLAASFSQSRTYAVVTEWLGPGLSSIR